MKKNVSCSHNGHEIALIIPCPQCGKLGFEFFNEFDGNWHFIELTEEVNGK